MASSSSGYDELSEIDEFADFSVRGLEDDENYDELIDAFDDFAEDFLRSLGSVCNEHIMDSKIPFAFENYSEKVFDETPDDVKYKQFVKCSFVSAVEGKQIKEDIERSVDLIPHYAVIGMMEWCHKHYNSPYPSKREVKEMSKKLGISDSQISGWFSFFRKMVWSPLRLPEKDNL